MNQINYSVINSHINSHLIDRESIRSAEDDS